MTYQLARWHRNRVHPCCQIVYAIIASFLILFCVSQSHQFQIGHFTQCIKRCVCDMDTYKRRRVVCESGGLTRIPTDQIHPNTKVLILDGSHENTSLNLGKAIFDPFRRLEEVKISHYRLPAIGDSSFWPGINLKSIDLSHNHIRILTESDFNGLDGLKSLNLSDNKLKTVPSATFKRLTNLTELCLAHNQIKIIVPRMFYKLDKLEYLDLSANPLERLKSENFNDVHRLRNLSLRACKLRDPYEPIFKNLTKLVELDLRDNRLTFLTSFWFKGLESLRQLRLDGNELTIISDHTFDSLKLHHLGLSGNHIEAISTGAFLNSVIHTLDLSSNRLKGLLASLFDPLASSLKEMNLNHNHYLIDPPSSVSVAIKPLRNLQRLFVSNISLDSSIDVHTFINTSSLLLLDLSYNNFEFLNASLFVPLIHLEQLNLSNNHLITIHPSVLETFSSVTTLRRVDLHNNPWSCYRCHIRPIIEWLNSFPPAYFNLCPPNRPQNTDDFYCIKCSEPFHLQDRDVRLISDEDFEDCSYIRIQMRLTYSQQKIEILLGLLVITSLTFLFIVIALIYRRQGADYYTHEKDDEVKSELSKSYSHSHQHQMHPSPSSSPVPPSFNGENYVNMHTDPFINTLPNYSPLDSNLLLPPSKLRY